MYIKKNNTNYRYIIVIGTLSFATLLYFVLNKKYFFVVGEDGVNPDGTLTDKKMGDLEKYITSHINLANTLMLMYTELQDAHEILQKNSDEANKKKTGINDQISTIQFELESLQQQKEENNTDKTKFETLSNQITQKTELLKTLQETYETSNKDYEELEKVNNNLQTQLNKLKDLIGTLDDNKKRITQEMPDLTKR
jgi:chromosome segregation ATPase